MNKLITILTILISLNIRATNINQTDFNSIINNQKTINAINLQTDVLEAKIKLYKAEQECQSYGGCGNNVNNQKIKNDNKQNTENIVIAKRQDLDRKSADQLIKNLNIRTIINNQVIFSNENMYYAVGDELYGFLITSIKNNTVIFKKEDKKIEIFLSWEK